MRFADGARSAAEEHFFAAVRLADEVRFSAGSRLAVEVRSGPFENCALGWPGGSYWNSCLVLMSLWAFVPHSSFEPWKRLSFGPWLR